MPDPTFDKTTGWWYLRWRDNRGVRTKQPLLRDPRWKGRGHKIVKPPPEVALLARKYQDIEMEARHGVNVAKARPIELEAELTDYRNSYAASHPITSVKALDQALGRFRIFATAEGLITFQSIGPAHCRAFLESGHRSGLAHATSMLDKKMLAAIWSRARKDRRVTENPWRDAAVPGKPSDAPPKFWTTDELTRMIAGTSGYLRDVIQLGVNCGARITSLLRLRWHDVDFEQGVIRLDSKTGRYQVPMSRVAREVLKRRRVDIAGPWVFPSSWTGEPIKMVTTYGRLALIARKVGLPPEKKSYNHILRHTFASHALMNGVPLSTVSKWLGHSSIHMTMRYSHLCEFESRKAMDSFEIGRIDPNQPPPKP